jgi:serine protease AprX
MRFPCAAALTLLAPLLAGCLDDRRPATPSEPLDRSILGIGPLLGRAPLDEALEDALDEAGPGDLIEIVVDVEALGAVRAVADALAGLGAGVVALEHLPVLGAIATPAVISATRLLPGVQGIYLNRRVDYLLAEGVTSIRADAVHALGYTGRGVGIAIMDSGIDGLVNSDVAHPAKTVQNVKFAASLRDLTTGVALVDEADALFVEDLPNTETSMGHGTHVAAIAGGTGAASGGKYAGVAPGADLIGVSVGDALFIFWILAGFDWILENRELYNIQVVNNSWGTEGAYDGSDPINEATRALHSAGIAVVFAAGNSGPDANTLNPYSAAPWVISVAAGCKLMGDVATWRGPCADAGGRDAVLAGFSSRGVPGDALVHPDVTAPGVLIVSGRASTGLIMTGLDAPDDLTTCAIETGHLASYTCASGTSMAAPHVAGVIALLEEASGGTLTPAEALDVLAATAQPLDGYAEWEVGAGYVDALAAVQAVLAR